jgi:hypothetical protein
MFRRIQLRGRFRSLFFGSLTRSNRSSSVHHTGRLTGYYGRYNSRFLFALACPRCGPEKKWNRSKHRPQHPVRTLRPSWWRSSASQSSGTADRSNQSIGADVFIREGPDDEEDEPKGDDDHNEQNDYDGQTVDTRGEFGPVLRQYS